MADSIEVLLSPTHGAPGTLEIGEPSPALDLLLSPIYRGSPGPKGDPGDAGAGAGPIQTLTAVAAGALGGHRVVGPTTAGTYSYVDNATLLDALRTVGVTTGAASTGAAFNVMTEGPVTEPSWAWTPNAPIYVGTNGTLTQAAPTSPAKFVLQIGFALTATTMFVRRRDPIYL